MSTKLSISDAKQLFEKIGFELKGNNYCSTLELMIKEKFNPKCSIYLLYKNEIFLDALNLIENGYYVSFTGPDLSVKESLNAFFHLKVSGKGIPSFLGPPKPIKRIELPRLYEMREHLNSFFKICIWVELKKNGNTDNFKKIVLNCLIQKAESNSKTKKHIPAYNWAYAYDWPGDIEEFQKYIRHGLKTSFWGLPGKWTKPIDFDSYKTFKALLKCDNSPFQFSDETHTPPVSATELAGKLSINKSTISNRKRPLGKLFQNECYAQNTKTPRLCYEKLFPVAREAMRRSKKDEDREILNEIEDLIKLWM